MYSQSNIRCNFNRIHAPMQCFQNVPFYFVTFVSNACKMFIKYIHGLGFEATPREEGTNTNLRQNSEAVFLVMCDPAMNEL
jgi:hypothetical protein